MARASATKRSDGRYQVKYQGKTFYGKTAREANAKCAEYKRMMESGLRIESQGMTVRQYASRWLATYKASVGDKTYSDYAKQLNVLVEKIGDMCLMNVKPDHIKEVYNHYIGYSASTIKRARMIYVDMFNAAIENGYARINPCKSKEAQPHKGSVGSHRMITDEERRLIHNTEHRFRAGAMLMLYAGLRRGEVLPLDVDKDVDFDAMQVHVTKAVRFDSNQPVMTDPKTEAGCRSVPLLATLADALTDVHGLAIPSAQGKICSDIAFRRGWSSYMLALSKAAGHPVSIRPHDLRHSYCTMLRDAGVDMKLAMQWMGHADEKMILRIYDHVNKRRVESAVNSIENYMGVKMGVKTD